MLDRFSSTLSTVNGTHPKLWTGSDGIRTDVDCQQMHSLTTLLLRMPSHIYSDTPVIHISYRRAVLAYN